MIGFIGYGNLPRSLTRGLIKSGAVKPDEIAVNVKTEETYAYAASIGHKCIRNLSELIYECDTLFIAVKPKVFDVLKAEISACNLSGKRFVSVMAMYKTENLKAALNGAPVARIMPSLAARDMHDVIGYYTKDNGFDDIKKMLSGIGTVIDTDEDKLDAITVIASCGLGFAGLILDEYTKSAEKLGFTHDEAVKITEATFANAAHMMPYDELYNKVATKGGATEQGLVLMKEKGISDTISAGIDAAYRKATGK